jgi:hypothetical protein
MPFTPFHAGPAVAIKAVIPRYFSFTVFCFVQLVMDGETAYHMIRYEYPVHRWMHTYLGATLVAFIGIIIGRPICQVALRIWTRWRDAPFRRFFPTEDRVSWTSAAVAAFVGAYSHVFFDSITHRDVEAFQPFSANNPLYSDAAALATHVFCFALGLIGTWYLVTRPPSQVTGD